MRIERRRTKLMLMGIIVLLITTGIFVVQPPETVEMCNPGTQTVQSVPANTVDNRLNAGWTFSPCVIEVIPSVLSSAALGAPPLVSTPHSTGRPPDVTAGHSGENQPPVPTRRPPEVPPENPPGHFTEVPPIVPTPVPTSPPTLIPTFTPSPTASPTSIVTPTLTPTVEPNLAPIPAPIEVPILIMTETPRLVPTIVAGGSGVAAQTPPPTNDVQLLIDFIERNPGVLLAILAIIGLIPLVVRAEVNRRMLVFKDQLEDNKQQRKLIDRQQTSLEKSDEIRLQERREAREDFLNALSKQASESAKQADLQTREFAKQSELQTNKFSSHIGQLASNQAATTAALEQNNAIAVELVEQLKLIREDAAKRDELHRTVRKAVEDNGQKVKLGFREVSKTIKELAESVSMLKSKWEEHHHFDETVIEELQNVKRIIENVVPPSEHPKGES